MRERAPFPVVVAASVAVLAVGVALAGPIEPSAAVAWPPSSGLLVGEVVTGGTSASDEFVEIYNASATTADLGGLELVYVTSTGGTITRKATWSGGTLLASGRHLLVANSSGTYASIADALYSGGFAATGGALVLRPIGGSPIDSVGWGDATNAFVEGTAAVAPPAGQSIERRPGGLGGNGTDSNGNAQDFFVDAAPAAQNLAAPPVPAAQPTPISTLSPAPTPTLPPTADPSATPPDSTPAPEEPTTSPTTSPTAGEPTASPSASPSSSGLGPTPSPTATAESSTSPTPSGSADPTAAPSPGPSASPTPSPTATASATPLLESVAQARAEANGRPVDVIATLTTPVGLIEGGTGAFVQDETAGISLYLASADWMAMPAGTLVRIHGTVDDRYAQRTIRLVTPTDVTALGPGVAPIPVDAASGAAAESLEGRAISVVGRVVAVPDTLTDGFAVTVDDGSGQLRVIATLPSGIVPGDLPAQGWFRLSGPLGQRDSSGTGSAGYRLYLRSLADVVAVPDPTPNPTPSPAPTATPSQGPSGGPSPSPTPAPTAAATASPTPVPTAAGSPSPSSTPAVVIMVAAARALPLGSVVTVEGVATVEAGRIVDANTTVIQDATAGVAIRLPAAGWPAFARGDVLRIRGVVGQRYGNLELRPASAAAISVLGHGSVPAPRPVVAADFGEPIEGRLVRGSGVVVSVDPLGASGNFGLDLKDATGTMRVFVYGTSGMARDAFPKGATVEITGIEGQHAPSTGSTAGHRVWPRDRADVRIAASIQPSPGATVSPGSGSSGRVPIATAILSRGSVVVEGTVTTPPGFVDADGRRLVIEDDSGALLVRLPVDSVAPGVGSRIVAGGSMGTYYGSPQLALDGPPSVSGTTGFAPRILGAPPTADLAWRLVRVSGQVANVHRLGTTWRAELTVGGTAGFAVPIYGVARSGVPSTALIEGRSATVTGIVRPPYPTATDRRPAVAPRFPGDVILGGSTTGGVAANGSNAGGSGVGPGSGDPAAPLDIELGELGDHAGALVRVGGLVLSSAGTRIEIDDGTATAAILLPPDATGLASDVLRGDPLNAVGTVIADGAGWAVAPRTAADIARVGRLGELAPIAGSSPAPTDSSGLAPERLGAHGEWPLGTLPTAFALAGTALTMALRRRETVGIGRRLVGIVVARLGR